MLLSLIFSRRSLLKGGLATPVAGSAIGRAATRMVEQDYDIDCGVTSGSPSPDGFVVWTRLPPVARDGATDGIEVTCEVATAPDFRQETVVRTLRLATGSDRDYTVKAAVAGLDPAGTYHFRFVGAAGWKSAAGVARTAPAAGGRLDQVRFAVVGCQQFSQGYYTAYDHLLREDIAFCVHLGDHIYEKESGKVRDGDPLAGREAKTLADYRRKYRYYLSDPAYRAVRGRFTWIDLWDDHEVFNDYSGRELAGRDPDRMAAAYQAYLDYMPVIAESGKLAAGGIDLRLYRSHVFGDLVELFATDQRQYREAQVCSRPYLVDRCRAAEAPGRTMLGAAQREWLFNGLAASSCRWQVLASEVMVAPLMVKLFERGAHEVATAMWGDNATELFDKYVTLDAWDGYPAERDALLTHLEREGLRNTVVLTGDIHAAFDAEVRHEGASLSTPVVCHEVVTTSISSSTLGDRVGPIVGRDRVQQVIASSNPHFKWSDVNGHGYLVVEATPAAMTCRHVVVDTVEQAVSGARVARTFVVPAR